MKHEQIIDIDSAFPQAFVVWLDVVTYLHHHGYDKKVPWYRGEVRIINTYTHICFPHEMILFPKDKLYHVMHLCSITSGMELHERGSFNH